MSLQPPVHHFPHPIVAVAQEAAHEIRRLARIKRRDDHEGTIAHELVGMSARRGDEYGHGLGRGRTAQQPRRRRSRGVVEGRQAVDVRGEVL